LRIRIRANSSNIIDELGGIRIQESSSGAILREKKKKEKIEVGAKNIKK